MSKLRDIHAMLIDLYKERQYDEVINKVNKLLNGEIRNERYVNVFRYLRAKSYRAIGNCEEALKELKELVILESENSYFHTELFFVYYFFEKYKEALKMLPKLYLMEDKNISNHSLSIMELVIRKNLYLPMSYGNDEKCEYLKSQIVYYSEDLAFEHITSHKYFEEGIYNIHSMFEESVNLKYLFECVKKDIKNSKKASGKDVLEPHYFAVPGLGYDGNNKCNYLKVIVCPGTKNIITMYPYAFANEKNIPLLNCDLDKLFNRTKKETTNSRIDKFNKRFNLK